MYIDKSEAELMKKKKDNMIKEEDFDKLFKKKIYKSKIVWKTN